MKQPRPLLLQEVFLVLAKYEEELLEKAANAGRRGNPLMSGYWQATAIHCRHLKARFRKLAHA